MGPLLVVGLLFLPLAIAGPLSKDAGTCARECSADSKFKYTEGKTYLYFYEATNTMRMETGSELSSLLKASVYITRLSTCEMILKVKTAEISHGSAMHSDTEYIQDLKKYPTRFSWNDGQISHICPHPKDSANINNMKRGILSALQNSMNSLDHDTLIREKDVLGSCNTEYKVKSHSGKKVMIHKTKDLATCSDHLKGRTGFTGKTYISPSSPLQHFPFTTDQEYYCHNVINDGIVEEVFCTEKIHYKPLGDYGHHAKARAEVKLQLLSQEKASALPNLDASGKKESLIYLYESIVPENKHEETVATLQELCTQTSSLLDTNVGVIIHKLIRLIKGLQHDQLKTIYESLKSKTLCQSSKVLGIFIDSLKASASEGSVKLLKALANDGSLSSTETTLWLTAMPFASDPTEGAVLAASDLLHGNNEYKQAWLSVPSMAYKYCFYHDDCESSPAIKEVTSALQEHLINDCQADTEEKEQEIILALKGYGNLGYFSKSIEPVLKCASTATNSIHLRATALESFRRTPCSDKISSKLFEYYENQQEVDELRMAALITLGKCPSPQVIYRIAKTYNVETSKQVEVFTWSYLENLKQTSDPTKEKARFAALQVSLKSPSSVDIMRFSRNLETSRFVPELNLGYSIEGNLIHSRESFIPRSGNLDFSLDVFGRQLDFLEVGVRAENWEHLLEYFVGPSGVLSTHHRHPYEVNANGSVSETYKTRIQALKDKVGLKMKHPPKGSYYIRILGNEMRYREIQKDDINQLVNFNLIDFIRESTKHQEIDSGQSLLVIDSTILLPSVTGRAYKMSENGSASLGFQANRKFKKLDIRNMLLDVEGNYKPSANIQFDAALTIHGEDYEPGLKIATNFNSGSEFDLKVKLEEGPAIDVKLDFPQTENRLFSLSRTFYEINQDGEKEIHIYDMHDFQYCTKYLQKVSGLEFCGSLKMPHLSRKDGRHVIPFLGPMQAVLHMKKTEASMNGFDFRLHLPVDDSDVRTFLFHVDTPNSKVNRKLSLEVETNRATGKGIVKLDSPFYHFNADASYVSKEDRIEVKVNADGDSSRKYSLILDVEKHVKGARLAEYKPTMTIKILDNDPLVFSGNFIFSKGRKEMISFTMNSESIPNLPFSVKGNAFKEGSLGHVDSNVQLTSDVTITVRSKIYKMHSTYTRTGLNANFDLALDCSTDKKNPKSIKLKAALKDVSLQNSVSFTLESEMLSSEHSEYNFQSNWDFKFKLHRLLKNDISIKYGANFEEEIHLIQLNRLEGDFVDFHQMNFENKLGIKLPFAHIDKSVFLIANWNIEDKPKVHLDVGYQISSDKYVKAEANFESYKQLTERPVRFTCNLQVLYYDYEFKYQTEVRETSPNLIQGREVIQTHPGHQITVDYVYTIRSTERVFFHEFEYTIAAPNLDAPIQHKTYLKRSQNVLEFGSRTDTGNMPPFVFDVKLNSDGPGELTVDMPFVVGKLKIDSKDSETSLDADFKTVGREPQTISGTGLITHGSSEHMITANLKYAESINVAISGKVNRHIVHGPHELRGDFSGSIEPMSVVINYEIKDGHLNSFVQYLRSGSEKLKLDFNGKYIRQGYNVEMESGLFLTSPYAAFNGKEIYLHLLLNSDETIRNYEAEYRLKASPVTGYVGKLSYNRKRGWPGYIKSSALITMPRRVLYESSTALIYGNGKYSFKTTMVPSPKKRFNLETTAEFATRYASFQHYVETSLQHLQLVRINAIADLRDLEDYKLQSVVDVNAYKVYDLNATMSMKSITDFDIKGTLLGNITPSLHIYSKAHNANSLTKYTLSFEKDSVEIMSGKGEIKKRKRGFSGDMALSFKGKEVMTVGISNEIKSQKERNYVFKIKSFYRTYTISVNWQKDNEAIKHTINLCRNENDHCITIITSREETDTKFERHLTYKRANIELNFERITEDTPTSHRRYFLLHSGSKRYGYDITYGNPEINQHDFGLVLMGPIRDWSAKSKMSVQSDNPFFNIEVCLDAKRHPERKLVFDLKFHNEIRSKKPSKLEVSLGHPSFEKPIELTLIVNHDREKTKYLEADMIFDFSKSPEHKILFKLEVLRVDDHHKKANLNIYHQDEQHLAYTVKYNRTLHDGKFGFAIETTWKDSENEDQRAFIILDADCKEEKFNFVYHRPRLDFSIDAARAESQGLHQESSVIDVVSKFNGEVTKTKLIQDYTGKCYEAHVVDEEGHVTRKIEICIDHARPVLFSLKTTSVEEEQLVFDYSLEIIQVEGELNVRHHWNPEFLGNVVFQFTRVTEEIMAAGFGTLPMLDSPSHQKIRQAFISKVSKPWREFSSKEFKDISNEFHSEIKFLKDKGLEYWNNLPSTSAAAMVRRISRVLKPAYDEFVEDMQEHFEEAKTRLKNLIEDLIQRSRELRLKLAQDCENIPECHHLKLAIIENDWQHFLKAFKNLFTRLPEPMSNRIKKAAFIVKSRLHEIDQFLKLHLGHLQEYKVVQDVMPFFEEVRMIIRQQFNVVSQYFSEVVVKQMKVYFLQFDIRDYFSAELKSLTNIQNMDHDKLYSLLKEMIEEYLSTFRVPSFHNLVKVNSLDGERGVFNLNLYFPLNVHLLAEAMESIFEEIATIEYVPTHFNWKQLLLKVKRIRDLQFIPPYEESAVILSDEHYITFDKTFYDFAGECAYLLASDLEDGNFSLVVTPTFSFETDKSSGERQHALGIFVKSTSVLVNLADKTVKAGDKLVDLPYVTNHLAVTREGNVIHIDDYHGVQVNCHTVHQLCFATMSGWYYGKTGGLFGTYDYEPSNDFKRPKGQIPPSVTTFAKSWDISKACKTKNLAQHEVKIDKSSEDYKVCREYFADSNSPLHPCFSEVNPEKYFSLCYNHRSTHSSKTEALCTVAAAYVMECEHKYIELDLPPKCITCEAPDGSIMKHGEKKKYEQSTTKSSDVVFVIESSTCNDRLLKDIDQLSRAIDKELTNDGYRNNLYGMVVYGGEYDPVAYTAHGKILFPIDDVTSSARRIHLTSAPSTLGLEALRLAVTYPFRSTSSKSIVFMSCSPCKYDYTSLHFPVIQQILLQNEIVLHVINNQSISLRKFVSKERSIIGADAETVYNSRDVTQKELVGEPSLRSQASIAKDACVTLAQDVSGSVFSTQSMAQEQKAWRSIFARRLLKTAAVSNCRWCDCTSTADHSPKVICRPCESKRPRLPFSVCMSCALPDHLNSVSSYLLNAVL